MKTQAEIWHSPMLCGCWIEKTHTWDISPRLRKAIADQSRTKQIENLWIARLEAQGYYDEVKTTYRTLERCDTHAVFLNDTELATELHRFTGNALRPAICTGKAGDCCSIYFWFENIGVPADKRIHVPVEHPVYTRRCHRHSHLVNAVDHSDVVHAEMRKVSWTIANLAATLKRPVDSIPYRVLPDGELDIDHDALGYSQSYIESILDGTAASLENAALFESILRNYEYGSLAMVANTSDKRPDLNQWRETVLVPVYQSR